MAFAGRMHAGENGINDAQPRLAPNAVIRDPISGVHEAVAIRRGLERAHHGGANCDDASAIGLRLVNDRRCPLWNDIRLVEGSIPSMPARGRCRRDAATARLSATTGEGFSP